MIIICSNCGAKNRVDERAAANAIPKCGRCHAQLSLPTAPIEVTDQNLASVLADAGDRPVLVDCWAAWCGPCRMIAPTIDSLAAEAAGRWVVGKLDVDQNQQTAARFQVDGIPALLIFKRGQLVEKLVGLQPKEAIVARLSAAI